MRLCIVLGLLGAALPFAAPGLLFAAPGPAKKLPPLDYRAYFEVLPQMQDLSNKSNDSIGTLHTVMKTLEQAESEDQAEGLRAEVRQILLDHRAMKERMIGLVNRVLKIGEPQRTNLQALRALRNKSLTNVRWDNTFLKYVARELAQTIGVPINLNPRVQELNQVEIDFAEISAEGVMQIICNNFDLQWIIYGGEFVVVKTVNPNEARFLAWEEKHGKVDWIAEDKAGSYDDLPYASPKRKLKKLEDMDLPLLQQKITKMYILEGESKRHEIRLRELKMMAQIVAMFEDAPKTEEDRQNRIKRHKHIFHYLLMEKENSIEVWDLINKVLGERLVVSDEDAELSALLSTPIKRIEWQEKDLEDALYELGAMVGVRIEVDLPPFVELAVDLSVENVTLETVIGLICTIHPMDWRYVSGKLFFAHIQVEDR